MRGARRRSRASISMHSFTPVWKGRARPWEVGVLWDRDGRLAQPLMAQLARAGFAVGDNEPYSGELENDCLYRHGTMNGLPHVLIEIRQDLIADDARRARSRHALNRSSSVRWRRWARRKYDSRGRWPHQGDDRHGRTNPHRTGSRRLPPSGRASARAHRCAEHRPDESRRLLPQLPGRLVSRGGGREGHRAGKGQAREIVYGMPPRNGKSATRRKRRRNSRPLSRRRKRLTASSAVAHAVPIACRMRHPGCLPRRARRNGPRRP